MKTHFLLPALALILASCSKYQVNVLSSANMTKDGQTGKFSSENDTVKITYSFSGRNAPISLEVYNKLNEPLYIDWQRSDLIMNDKAVSYADNQVHISGDVSGSAVGNRTISYASGSIDAVATLPKNVMFVPPHAQVSSKLLEASDEYFNLPDNVFVKKEVPNTTIAGGNKVKIGEFEQANSPLIFKSYLTMYTLNNNQPKFVAYQHNFFVSKVINLNESPEFYYFSNRGDYYYTQSHGTNSYYRPITSADKEGVVTGAAAPNRSAQ